MEEERNKERQDNTIQLEKESKKRQNRDGSQVKKGKERDYRKSQIEGLKKRRETSEEHQVQTQSKREPNFQYITNILQTACTEHPCAQGAPCRTGPDGQSFKCICPAGFTGRTCENGNFYTTNFRCRDIVIIVCASHKSFPLKPQPHQILHHTIAH